MDKAIRCLEMLIFKYEPKIVNVFEEEEALIENYLNMERKVVAEREPDEDDMAFVNQEALAKSKVSNQNKGSRVSQRGTDQDQSKV